MKIQNTLTVPATAILSESLILAVKGEFYNYDYKFLSERPVFALLKCKSQKGRPVAQLSDLGSEANVLFCFGNNSQVIANSISFANSSGVLKHKFDEDFFGETYLGHTNISQSEFHVIRDEQKIDALVKHCTDACSNKSESISLNEGNVFAVTTKTRKYGLFLVESITSESMLIRACHILL